MDPLRPLAAALLLCGCAADLDTMARARWESLRSGTCADPVGEAAAVAAALTPFTAEEVEQGLGAFEGEARLHLLAGLARVREGGVRRLAEKLYGRPLKRVFPVAFGRPPDEDAEGFEGTLDEPALADALANALPDDPLAWLWLAAAANTPDAQLGERVRERMGEDRALRRHVRLGLDAPALRRELLPELLSALGAPDEDVEREWLVGRYRASLEAGTTGGAADEQATACALLDAWEEAFDDAPPLPPEDVEAVRALADLDSTEPEDLPPFDRIASFLERRARTGWPAVLRAWKDADRLPPDALARTCRASVLECGEALRDELYVIAPAAADVAVALEGEFGDAMLTIACDLLPPDEAVALARRGAGAGMPLPVRESAADCLSVRGRDAGPLAVEVMTEAALRGEWFLAERVAANHELDEGWLEQAALARARGGDALGAADLLVRSDEGLELLRDEVLRRRAPDMDPQALARASADELLDAARVVRSGGRKVRLVKIEDIQFPEIEIDLELPVPAPE